MENKMNYSSLDVLEKARQAQDEGDYKNMEVYLQMAVDLEKAEMGVRLGGGSGRMEHLLRQIVTQG